MGRALLGHDVKVLDSHGAPVVGEEGYLWFRARKDDVIISMAYRIGPGEIAESLMKHPAVAMCAVIGVPEDIRGEVPKAFVVLREGVEPDAELLEELQQHVRTRLAAHEVPRVIEFIDDLPRTTSGKIMRRTLRGRTLRGRTLRGRTLRGRTLRGRTLRGRTLRGRTLRGET